MQMKSNKNRGQLWLPGALLIPALCAFVSCSTFNSDYYMEPREKAGVGTRTAKWADYAEIRAADYVVSIRVPVSGSRRHCLGPALFPFVPTVREWPQALQLEMVIAPKNPKAKVRMDPSKWKAHVRGEEFGKTFPKDEFKTLQPYTVFFHEGTAPLNLNSKGIGSWKPKQVPFEFSGSAVARVNFAEYDNRFIDFELRDMAVEIDGKEHRLPTIQFKRKSRWKYTPWTLKIFDM